MGPSEALTTNPSVLGILATPVQKVISVFSYYHSPLHKDKRARGGFLLSQAFVNNMTLMKHTRILHTSLGTLSSTSFLVSDPPIPVSLIRIHKPNYKKPSTSLAKLDFSSESEDDANISKEQIRSKNRKLRQQLKEARKHI